MNKALKTTLIIVAALVFGSIPFLIEYLDIGMSLPKSFSILAAFVFMVLGIRSTWYPSVDPSNTKG